MKLGQRRGAHPAGRVTTQLGHDGAGLVADQEEPLQKLGGDVRRAVGLSRLQELGELAADDRSEAAQQAVRLVELKGDAGRLEVRAAFLSGLEVPQGFRSYLDRRHPQPPLARRAFPSTLVTE